MNVLGGTPHRGAVPHQRLVELKARYEDLGRARAILADRVRAGPNRQTDTYFALGQRRLKLREVEGTSDAQLVYYVRPDRAGVKESDVLVCEVREPEALKEMLAQVLGIQVIVRKRRDVYRHEGVQVHLDEVDGLGRFLEFELAVEDEPGAIREGRAKLESLRKVFGIPDEDLVASSYSDLLAD